MTSYDEFVQDELREILRPGEHVLGTAFALVINSSEPFQRHYFTFRPWGPPFIAVATDQRILLIRLADGLLQVERVNLGVTEIRLSEIQDVATRQSGWIKSIAILQNDGRYVTLRLNVKATWLMVGQEEFWKRVPEILQSHAAANGEQA